MAVDPVLIVFAKSPTPGAVKTRLVPAIGAEAAARVQTLMTAATLRRARGWPCSSVVLAASPDPMAFGPSVADRVLEQGRGDLGARLRRVQQVVFADTKRGMLIVGTDAPDLPDERVASAGAALRRDRAVMCPADDGGYCLIGLPRPMPELFEGIAWGGDDVAARTSALAARHGLPLEMTAPWFDVDTIDDLSRLVERIRNSTDPALRELHAGLKCAKLPEVEWSEP